MIFIVNPRAKTRTARIRQLIREGFPDGHGQAGAIAYREVRAGKVRANSGKGRTMAKRRRRKLAGAALTAHLKKIGRKRRRSSAKRRHTINAPRKRGASMARRKTTRRRSSARRRVTSHKRRRHSYRPVHAKTYHKKKYRRTLYRRNPGFSLRGMGRLAMDGAVGGVGVIIGKAGSRAIRKLIPFGADNMAINLALAVLSSLATGFAVNLFWKRAAPFALAGAFADIITPYAAQVPVIGTYLGEDGDPMGVAGGVEVGDAGQRFLGSYVGDAGQPFLGSYVGGEEESYSETGY